MQQNIKNQRYQTSERLIVLCIQTRQTYSKYVSFASLIVLAAKIYLIARYSSEVPFWDEWDAQGSKLLVPYRTGQLSVEDLFAAHNEHFITFGRLLWLAVFTLADSWNVRAVMYVNALIHVSVFFILAFSLYSSKSSFANFFILAFLVFAYSLPFGWENTIWSMQSCTYLLLLFAVSSNVVLVGSRAFDRKWFAGTLLAGCSYLCMASGAITLLPFALVTFFQLILRERRGRSEWAGLLVHFLIIFACVSFVPNLNSSDHAGGANYVDFFVGLMDYLSWPYTAAPYFFLLNIVPIIILFLFLFINRVPIDDRRWASLLIALWSCAHMAMFAYGRSNTTIISSRYTDVILLNTAINIGLAIKFVSIGNVWRICFAIATGAWVLSIIYSLSYLFLCCTLPAVEHRHSTGLLQQANLQQFYERGELGNLPNAQRPELPYPFADRLLQLLKDDVIRSELPADISGLR